MKPEELKDITPADSSVLPPWLAGMWVQLRTTFMVGTFAAGIIIAVANWYQANWPAPPPATADQLQQQTTAIRDQVEATQFIVHQALQEYTDSLAMVRAEVEETMAKPILQNIVELNRQMRRLQQGQRVTGQALEEQRQSAEATTTELLQRINARPPDPSAELLRELLERMDAQEALIRSMDSPKRTSKQKF